MGQTIRHALPLLVHSILLALLSGGAVFSSAAETSSYASTAREAAVLLADNTVTTVHVSRDIVWDDAAFAGLPQPIVLARNITLVGEPLPTTGHYPTVVSAVFRKIRLAQGVTLTYRRMLFYPCRKGNHVQAPGCDLYAPCLPGEHATMRIEDAVVPQRICYGGSSFETALRSNPRPPWVPGEQLATPVLPQDGCDTSPSANVWTRCWARNTGYDDLAVFSADLVGDKPVLNGYALHFLRSNAPCGDLLTDQCVQEKGTLGCYAWWLQQNPAEGLEGFAIPPNGTFVKVQPQPAEPPRQSGPIANVTGNTTQLKSSDALGDGPSAGTGGGGGGGSRTNVLIGCLAGVLGGLGLVAVVASVLVLLHRRRTVREPHGKGPDSGEQATAVVVSLGPATPHPPAPQGAALGVTGSPADAAADAASGVDGDTCDVATRAACDSPFVAMQLSRGSETITSVATTGSIPILLSAGISGASRTVSGGNRASGMLTASGSDKLAAGAATAASDLVSAGSGWCGDVKRLEGSPDVVRLTPAVLGKGAHGRVVVGEYRGARVAVKVLLADDGGVQRAAGGAAAWETRPGQQQQQQALDVPDGGHGSDLWEEGPRELHRGAVLPDAQTLQAPAMRSGSVSRSSTGRCDSTPHLDAAEQLALCVTDLTLTLAAEDESGAGGHVGAQGSERGQASKAEDSSTQATNCAHTLAQEVEVLARCQHPNVVRLLAVCLTPPRLCLVMELMETSLDKLLYGGAGGGGGGAPGHLRLPLRSVLHIALDVAHGLAYLHPTIVHRDLKPANILVNGPWGDRPVAKVSDFGLSRMRNTAVETQNPEAGTPAYIAPELFNPYNSKVTYQADMYSFGVLLWAMLSGEEPWAGLNPVTIAYSVAMLHRRLPWQAVPQDRCPRKLSRLICQCWEGDPQRRPAAAEAAKQILLVLEEDVQQQQ